MLEKKRQVVDGSLCHASTEKSETKACYTAAFMHLEKLKPLGPWFHASDLARSSGFCPETVKQSLWRWSRDGLIHCLGGRSGMHHNSVFYACKERNIRQALARVTPKAIDASLSILTSHGIWTQHSKHVTLLQMSMCHVYKIEDVRFSVRSRHWLSALRACGAVHMGEYMHELTPGGILADVLIHEPARAPDPSDLDFEDLEVEDLKRLRMLMGWSGGDIFSIKKEYGDELMRRLERACGKT